MHSWRVWVLARVGLGIADFHSRPMENGIDIISGSHVSCQYVSIQLDGLY